MFAQTLSNAAGAERAGAASAATADEERQRRGRRSHKRPRRWWQRLSLGPLHFPLAAFGVVMGAPALCGLGCGSTMPTSPNTNSNSSSKAGNTPVGGRRVVETYPPCPGWISGNGANVPNCAAASTRGGGEGGGGGLAQAIPKFLDSLLIALGAPTIAQLRAPIISDTDGGHSDTSSSRHGKGQHAAAPGSSAGSGANSSALLPVAALSVGYTIALLGIAKFVIAATAPQRGKSDLPSRTSSGAGSAVNASVSSGVGGGSRQRRRRVADVARRGASPLPPPVLLPTLPLGAHAEPPHHADLAMEPPLHRRGGQSPRPAGAAAASDHAFGAPEVHLDTGRASCASSEPTHGNRLTDPSRQTPRTHLLRVVESTSRSNKKLQREFRSGGCYEFFLHSAATAQPQPPQQPSAVAPPVIDVAARLTFDDAPRESVAARGLNDASGAAAKCAGPSVNGSRVAPPLRAKFRAVDLSQTSDKLKDREEQPDEVLKAVKEPGSVSLTRDDLRRMPPALHPPTPPARALSLSMERATAPDAPAAERSSSPPPPPPDEAPFSGTAALGLAAPPADTTHIEALTRAATTYRCSELVFVRPPPDTAPEIIARFHDSVASARTLTDERGVALRVFRAVSAAQHRTTSGSRGDGAAGSTNALFSPVAAQRIERGSDGSGGNSAAGTSAAPGTLMSHILTDAHHLVCVAVHRLPCAYEAGDDSDDGEEDQTDIDDSVGHQAIGVASWDEAPTALPNNGSSAGSKRKAAGGRRHSPRSPRRSTRLYDFTHPEDALYFFSPSTASAEAARHLAFCGVHVHVTDDASGGFTTLDAIVDITLYDRAMKQRRRQQQQQRRSGGS